MSRNKEEPLCGQQPKVYWDGEEVPPEVFTRSTLVPEKLAPKAPATAAPAANTN